MNNTWQERFDEKFHVIEYEQDGEIHHVFSYSRSPAAKEIKQFISQSISEAVAAKEKEILEMIDSMYLDERKSEVEKGVSLTSFLDKESFNMGLNVLQAKLTASHARKEEGT